MAAQILVGKPTDSELAVQQGKKHGLILLGEEVESAIGAVILLNRLVTRCKTAGPATFGYGYASARRASWPVLALS
jgi:hypothetical protein